MMFEHKQLQNLQDYFTDLNNRRESCVYFYRINNYSEEIKNFILKYYEEARKTGVVIEGKIPNPTEKNLEYYNEIMGMNFQMSVGFIGTSLKKWLPRMNDYQRQTISMSVYDTLDEMRKSGKNDNMLKNAYIKFMCWLYYKFERIVSQLGENRIPKILYEGEVSNYELKLITILSNAGCDVVLLQYKGDAAYKKLDPESKFSINLPSGNTAFPQDFSIKWVRKEMENQMNLQRLYGVLPELLNCTNAWIKGKGLWDVSKSVLTRGTDKKLFYNCFIRINGVEDKLTYLNELYQFQLELKGAKRQLVIIENTIPAPSMEEISSIRRNNYKNRDQMLIDLSSNLKYTANMELQRLMNKAFIDVMVEAEAQEGMNLNKLTNKAVYLLCWQKRYQQELFKDWKQPDISVFIWAAAKMKMKSCF